MFAGLWRYGPVLPSLLPGLVKRMLIATLTFYLFAAVTVASGVMVIAARNPVHSVLFLILAFFNSAGLFVLMGAEFLAMVLVVVYVGAVAVLFLFVVMMLDVNFRHLRSGAARYVPIGGAVGLVLLAELVLVLGGWAMTAPVPGTGDAPAPALDLMSNTHALGHVLYTKYFYLFQVAGLILLVAMVGAIVLTLRHREGVHKQQISVQVSRRIEDTIDIVKVGKGTGIDVRSRGGR